MSIFGFSPEELENLKPLNIKIILTKTRDKKYQLYAVVPEDKCHIINVKYPSKNNKTFDQAWRCLWFKLWRRYTKHFVADKVKIFFKDKTVQKDE